MAKVNVATDLVVKECPTCGIFYAVPSRFDSEHQERGGSWYCPNGHSLHYVETEVMRLKQVLDQREAELESVHIRLDGALQEITTKKREVTRLKNRVKAGVCIECHRHFENLERHMKTKHTR